MRNKHENQRRSKHVNRTKAVPTKNEDDLYTLIEQLDHDPFLLVLDGIQDPHNLGACLRSADAAGVDAVIAPKDRAVSITDTVIEIASGAAQNIPFIQVTNLSRCLDKLKEYNIWLVGTSDHATQTLYQTDLKGPLALIMGAEGRGIRRLTEEKCDFLVNIPMNGSVECLNVSVATGVCLFEAVRQRSQK